MRRVQSGIFWNARRDMPTRNSMNRSLANIHRQRNHTALGRFSSLKRGLLPRFEEGRSRGRTRWMSRGRSCRATSKNTVAPYCGIGASWNRVTSTTRSFCQITRTINLVGVKTADCAPHHANSAPLTILPAGERSGCDHASSSCFSVVIDYNIRRFTRAYGCDWGILGRCFSRGQKKRSKWCSMPIRGR